MSSTIIPKASTQIGPVSAWTAAAQHHHDSMHKPIQSNAIWQTQHLVPQLGDATLHKPIVWEGAAIASGVVIAAAVVWRCIRQWLTRRPSPQWSLMAMAEDQSASTATLAYFPLRDIRYTVLARAELPADIQRLGFLEELRAWARWRFETSGYEVYGAKMLVWTPRDAPMEAPIFYIMVPTVEPDYPLVELEVGLDDELVPQGNGNLIVIGRHFVVRVRHQPTPVPFDAKPLINQVIWALSGAVERYCTFGTAFDEEELRDELEDIF